MVRRVWIVTILASLSVAARAQTKVYRFSKAFISSHYAQGNPIGKLAASASSPAKSVHRTRCGGNDGELHIGLSADAVDNHGDAISGPANDPEQFGIVAEPPSVTPSARTAIEAVKGQPHPVWWLLPRLE
jgi:hypothetical protein